MGMMKKMADKIRHGMRSFLMINPAPAQSITIQESMDFQTNVIKNRIWYRGDGSELSQFYKEIADEAGRTRFWSAVPTAGMDIRKIHTGIPAMMIDVLTSVVTADMNGIEVPEKYKEFWKKVEEENDFDNLLENAITEALIAGDGAFKITLDSEVSQYPILEFVPAENVEYKYRNGRIKKIIFKTKYTHENKLYVLEEKYGYGSIEYKLYQGEKEVSLNTLEETKELTDIFFDKRFIMAVPFVIFRSSKWKGRGKSVIDIKADAFDSVDEAWSQWMDALRKGRAKEYIPTNILPRNPYNGEIMRPNAFDNAYIQNEAGMGENQVNKIELVQPDIPHESYLQTYITALDICMQGIISPSTLGIDVKKLDNAEAQREKEKATLYTRNKIVGALQKALPKLVKSAILSYQELNRQQLDEDIEVNVNFGEYANPSFESQVETVGKAKQSGIMSIEASVEELYGDTKDSDWKEEEVKRLKQEQGIVELEEPAVKNELPW